MTRRFDAALAEDEEEQGFKPWTGADIPFSDATIKEVNQGGGLGEGFLDAGRGFAQGALAGGADELAAGARSQLGLGNFSDLLSQGQAEDRTSQERSPWLYGASRALGGLPRNLATGFLGGVAQGAGEGLLSSDAEDIGGRLQGAAKGAGTSALLHGVGEGVGLAGQAAGGTSRALGSIANDARDAALGGTAADFRKLAEEKGLDYAHAGPAQAAEGLGLTNRLIPQSPRTYANKAKAVLDTQGAEIGSALDDAGQNLATHTITDDLANDLTARGVGARDATTRGEGLQGQYDRMAGLLRSDRGPMLTPKALNEQKTAYYDQGYKENKVSDLPGSISAEAARGGGAAAKERLLGALQNTPDELGRYEGAAQKFGDASMIEDMARARDASNLAQPGGGFFSTLAAPATRALKNYGPDLTANVATLGRDASGFAEGLLNGAAPIAKGIGSAASSPVADAAAGGHDITDTALTLLQTNTRALGPYASKIAEAAASPERGAVSALISKLIQTDPEFRTKILPLLRGQETQ